MTTVVLKITFNSPFRVATGHAGGDADDTIDRERPLPATSLKGVLRDSARELFPPIIGTEDAKRGIRCDHPLITEVFGGPGGAQCPWHFSDAILAGPVSDEMVRTRIRIKVGENRMVSPGAMFIGEELCQESATAKISLVRPIPAERKKLHLALLRAAARLVDGIGADRRRGLGWVSITTDFDDMKEEMRYLLSYRDGEVRS